MEKEYRFYREENGNWYVDMPEWTGSKEDLQMVMGADVLLEAIGNNHESVRVKFSTEKFNEAHTLTHEGEGFYQNDAWHGPSLIWLCKVTEFVFGFYPDKIYYSKSYGITS